MLATVEARQGWGHLPEDLSRYDVFAAVEGCDDIGREFIIWHEGIAYLGIAADCAGHVETVEWMQENRIITEVSWETAVSWDIVGRGGVPINFAWVLDTMPVERCNIPL
jgi:hypothetical protein